MDYINIDDVARYFSDNEEIIVKVDRGSCDVNDILSNIYSTNSIIPEINASLSGLQKVSEKPLLEDTGENSFSGLGDAIDNLFNYYKKEATTLLAAIKYYETKLEEYDGGTIPSFNQFVDNATDEELNDLMSKVASIDKEGINFLSAFKTKNDVLYDPEDPMLNNMIETSPLGLTSLGLHKLMKSIYGLSAIETSSKAIQNIAWTNMTVGSAVILGLATYGYDYLTDEGEFTDLDELRRKLRAGSAAAKSAIWGIVYKTAASGPIAFAASVAAGFLFDKISDLIVGDNIIDKFTDEEGNVYEIPSNGNGKEGTYDVMLERMENKRFTINGEDYSETNYKKILYDDFAEMERMSGNSDYTGINAMYTNPDMMIEEFKKVLSIVETAQNPEDAKQLFYSTIHDSSYSWGHNMEEILLYLQDEYDFKIEEYYTYKTEGSISRC